MSYSDLLVSCIGAYENSGKGTGAFICNSDGENIIIDEQDTTGLYSYKGCYFRLIRTVKILACYDSAGIRKIWYLKDLKDPHDIIVEENRFIIVSTASNRIIYYDFTGNIIDETIENGDGDAWHLNCLEKKDGKYYASAFGKFSYHREWSEKGHKGKGICYSIHSDEIIFNGLNAPHNPRYLDKKWFICDSLNFSLKVKDEKGEITDISLGGFTRGFAFDETYIYIGISADRKLETSSKNSKIAVLDRKTLSRADDINIPYPEIYDIIIVEKEFAQNAKTNTRNFQIFPFDTRIQALEYQLKNERVEIERLKAALRNQNVVRAVLRKLKFAK